MKKRIPMSLAALSAAALALTPVSPASAAVTYTSTAASNVGDFSAIDTGSNTIYSIVQSSFSTSLDTYYDQTLTAVDAKTLKTKATLLIFENSDLSLGGPSVIDLRVNSRTHTVWLSESNPYGGGWVQEINGTTMKSVRSVGSAGGGSNPGEIAINTTTNTAYAAWDWNGVYSDASTKVAPNLSAINGSSGAVTTVTLATPTYDDNGYGEPGNVAFDSSNNGVYVSYNTHEYAYSSSTLKLASSVAYPSTETTNPKITADGSTHTIYVAGSSSLYKIAGSTNKIATTVTGTGVYGALPVVDPTIKTLYVGTKAYSETSLAATGAIPHAAASVNGSTHTIYSSGYVVTRSGS